MSTRFRKLPIEIEAVQWTGDNFDELFGFLTELEQEDDCLLETPGSLQVWNSEEGCYVTAPTWHWIIRGVKGELYPCSPDVLAATYEKV